VSTPPVVTLGGLQVTLVRPRSLLLVLGCLRTREQREGRPHLLRADGLACLADCWPQGQRWPVDGAPTPYSADLHSPASYGEAVARLLMPALLDQRISPEELDSAALAALVWAVGCVQPPAAEVERVRGNFEAPQGASSDG
jgi:hypothetical protein